MVLSDGVVGPPNTPIYTKVRKNTQFIISILIIWNGRLDNTDGR